MKVDKEEYRMLSIGESMYQIYHPGPEDFLHLLPGQIGFQKLTELQHTCTVLKQKHTHKDDLFAFSSDNKAFSCKRK